MHKEKGMQEHRRQPSASQGERPWENKPTNTLTLDLQFPKLSQSCIKSPHLWWYFVLTAECLCPLLPSLNSYVDVIFSVMVLEGGVVERWLCLESGMLMNGASQSSPAFPAHENTMRRCCLLTRKTSHQNAAMLLHWSWTSWPPELCKIKFRCL